ncbi:DUF397 domain-containing protein [Amycolatopsis sp. lyj-23]|uniref:DUF397 domain-containing protein n=1 Tax=Amycolatopsis sp. lyj-23 TaxID=2789283 RepID=UPI00397B2C29
MDHTEARHALSGLVAGWCKASASQGQNGCFEFNFDVAGWVGVRDSKLGHDSEVLVFNRIEFEAMLAGARAGEFDGRIQ